MRSKTQTQNKFMKIITCPIRVLSKARDFYVKSMMGCAGRRGYGGHAVDYPIGQFSSFPRSFSESSRRSSGSNDDEDTRELIRAASARALGETRVGVVRVPKGLPKSSSVAVMGKIDEESPCEFSVGDGGDRGTLYPRRSRSYAVGKRNHVF